MIDKIIKVNDNKALVIFDDKSPFLVESDKKDAVDILLWILYSNHIEVSSVDFKRITTESLEDTQWLKMA